MQVSMSNQKSIESAIKNLEVQVGQLAKQLAERPSNKFTTNTEKNPKEECKAVMTRSKMAIQAEESRADQKVEGFKQQLADEPVEDLVELEEIVEEVKGDEQGETPIRDCQEGTKKKEEKEKEKQEETKEEEEKEKKLKNEKQKEKVIEIEKKKGKNEDNIEKKKEATPIESKEVPYPLVPSRKDKERDLARFLDIFKKLKMTLRFGEALWQMLLYAKFLKDMLTKQNRYIHSDRIVVEGNVVL